MNGLTLGVIGQGFVGKALADEFEARNFKVVRYSLEKEFSENKAAIATCDIVFIAVPTPTGKHGFDLSCVREVLSLVGTGAIAVIKSTVLPGSTEKLQQEFPSVVLLFSPEFLREKSAYDDVANPEREIIGLPSMGEVHKKAAEQVLDILPNAPYTRIVPSKEAELVKYVGNCFLATKVIFMNMVFDLAEAMDADYNLVSEAVGNDARIGDSHMSILDTGKRGAGGHCFIKDFAAFRALYEDEKPLDALGCAVLNALEYKNIELLRESSKDLDLLDGIYPMRESGEQ